jgi:hypothetical protein
MPFINQPCSKGFRELYLRKSGTNLLLILKKLPYIYTKVCDDLMVCTVHVNEAPKRLAMEQAAFRLSETETVQQ